MNKDLRVGEYRMLDNTNRQYPSFTVYQIIKVDMGEWGPDYTIKQVIRSKELDPYSDYGFDEQKISFSYAIISNSVPVDNLWVFNRIFQPRKIKW